jgi:monomeric sarcosine oxidase
LVDRAYQFWENLEVAASRTLLHRCGLMLAGRPEGAVIPGVQRAAKQHRLAIETVAHGDWPARFPGFAPDDDMQVLFEPDAGFLEVENCVAAHIEQAQANSAEILTGQRVTSWSAEALGVTVTTDQAAYTARNLVLCGGAWTNQLLSELGLPLVVHRKTVFWFGPTDDAYRFDRGCPVFGLETGDGFFYGFPAIDECGVKVGEHSGRQIAPDPDRLDREIHAEDEQPVRRFLRQYLPAVGPDVQKTSVCMYTMTPDEHFIIDRHPDYPHVAYACGFSGHGFKFAPVVGSALTDLIVDGRTKEPVEFLSASRPGL